jgi:acetyl/propionyl-CoA carboxylase alpha subunit
MMIKAVAGGGGRGMREVLRRPTIEAAHARCAAEARAASATAPSTSNA